MFTVFIALRIRGSIGGAFMCLYELFKNPLSSDILSLSFSVQAGGKHYHPTCARCARCQMMFTEGEEMYLTGEERSQRPTAGTFHEYGAKRGLKLFQIRTFLN